MRSEDGYIIQQCLDGDAAAFAFILEKYKRAVYALAYSRINNFHDAQDITQEVFIKAYQGLRSLKRWDSFMGWLYRITVNQCKDWIRANSRRPDGEFAEDQELYIVDHPVMDSYRENMVYESVREALDSLPETYREVMTLRYFGGMTVKEIARFLGVSSNTIDRRLKEARIRLKEEMVTMMSATYEQHSLPASFTFHMVEMVKRIKIHAMPRATGLPWGLSLDAGIAIAVMTLGSQMAIYQLSESLAFPGEIMPEVRAIPVDIVGAPGTSVISGRQGDIDGGGMDPRNPQNTSLLAPAMGGGTWTQKADMPTARCFSGAAEVDGKIYVIGGYTALWVTTTTLEQYSPATDTWTTIGIDMPTTRASVTASAVNGLIYAIGGWTGSVLSSAVEAYDPVADKWIKKANMPTPRDGATASVVDGMIYVIGGHNGAGDNLILPTVEAYDPATDTWIGKANMPTARWEATACAMDGRIYVFGGRTEWDWGPSLTTVEVYDPATDTWAQVSDMPWARRNFAASPVDGKIYLIGGEDPAMIDLFNAGKLGEDEVMKLFSTVDVYDPGTDTWATAANLPTIRSGLNAVVVNGKIYTIGGKYGPTNASISIVEEYDPGLPDNIAVTSPAGKLLTTWGKVRATYP